MKNTLLILMAVVLAGAAGFYGGMKYQESRRNSFFAGRAGVGGGMMFRNGENGANFGNGTGQRTLMMGGSRPVTGEILEVGKDTITVKTDDDSSKIVLLNNKTQIRKAETGAMSDLEKGKQVMVVGTENNDGSVSAQNIQLNLRLNR